VIRVIVKNVLFIQSLLATLVGMMIVNTISKLQEKVLALTASHIMPYRKTGYPAYQLLVASANMLNEMVHVQAVPATKKFAQIDKAVRLLLVILMSKSLHLVNVNHVDLTKDHKELGEAVHPMRVHWERSLTMMVPVLLVHHTKSCLPIRGDARHVHVVDPKLYGMDGAKTALITPEISKVYARQLHAEMKR
jgi:hypothetical protein